MKKITKIKISKEEQTLKKYLLTVNKISQLNKTKKTLVNTIINDILNIDVENSKKSLHHKTIGNIDIVLKLSTSYSINQTEIAKVIPEIFEELGAEVIAIGNEPDGYNINQNCGSTHPEVIKEAVIEHRADYGISLDGDGDRVILVDEKGNILDGDDLLYILAFANPNRAGPWSGVVGTHMSNLGFEEGIKKLGYKFVRADVGDKYVSEMLSNKGWLLGGEVSGHIICKDLVSTGDGTIAALKVISSLLLLEKKPSEVLLNYTKIPQINMAVTVKNKDIINDKELKSLISEIESDLTVGRVLVRPSGTEPKIRIMIEASEEKVAKKFANDIKKIIESKS